MRGHIFFDVRDEEFSVVKYTHDIYAEILSDLAAAHDDDPEIRQLGEEAVRKNQAN